MKWISLSLVAALSGAGVTAACAQEHTPGMRHGAALPTQSGQSAYGAIGEIVRLLEADPATDWSRVSIERLRQHLVDMDEVTLRSRVVQTEIPGGARIDVTGEGRTVQSIRGMTRAHGAQEDATSDVRIQVEEIPGGARLTVTARQPGDALTVARLRGLGFIGLMTRGDHHAPHHLAMARGSMDGH